MDLKKDNIDALFEELHGQFDIEEPTAGHEERFLERLNSQSTLNIEGPSKKRSWWKPLSIAASLAILIALGAGVFVNTQKTSKVAPEVEKTQFYFASLLEQEIEKINKEVTPETQKMVDDAMLQIKKLDNDYKKLEQDLKENGNTKKILHAMITNFQTRIDLLQDVLNQIEEVKQLKDKENALPANQV
ncbi:hypothetical protein SAMN04487906_2943 [Zhouia amylolytica]|uniref:DUF4179 domain-containing protein n=2 Tax=Zhouia amylolytica TaxID=376730 RepID=W2URH9_9FLAO|nr:hypothetical protein [Zhouia amylolytica]ETN96559.1 hypothetical protein P278_06370 [Zhouia amylolytica AD3]MCQ0109955.1 hypothetical protein [Zhouia amylolytica]SFT09923.1 hypothetical protein SAMN04487906_2943 [Zhouia amylolytica]